MKKIAAIILSLLCTFSLSAAADLAQELKGTWGGELTGVTTKSMIDADGDLAKAIIKSHINMVIEQAQDQLCTAEYTWENVKGHATGYDGHKYVDQNHISRLCRYQDNRLTFVGEEGFLYCDYTAAQGTQNATLSCELQRSTLKHSIIGYMVLTKK